MSDTGNWSNDSDQGTPLPPRLAAVVRAASAEVMDTGGNFDVASSIFGTRTPTRKKGKQSITGQMRMSSLLPPPATPSASTTPLLYNMLSPMTPAPSTFSTPCPAPRYAKDPLAKKLHEFTRLMQDPAYNLLSSLSFGRSSRHPP
jgi:hypothetical protein